VIRNYVNEAERGEDMQAKNHFKKQQKRAPSMVTFPHALSHSRLQALLRPYDMASHGVNGGTVLSGVGCSDVAGHFAAILVERVGCNHDLRRKGIASELEEQLR
jgi:hypothetical protein